MRRRRYLFPHVIEMNHQGGHRLGVNVYLIEDGNQWALIDVGYQDTADEIIEIIRQIDLPLSECVALIATHADVDHTQGLSRLQEVTKAPVAAHAASVSALEQGDPELCFATIKAQGINLPMPPVQVTRVLNDGDIIKVGSIELEVWSTPGHTEGQLSFRLPLSDVTDQDAPRSLLFVGDNIYADGTVGVIDAHHGSHLPHFVESLQRILADDSEFLLPSHGPIFPRDNDLIRGTIERLSLYQRMADFGTCATHWPLMDSWEDQLRSGQPPILSREELNAVRYDRAALRETVDADADTSGRLPGPLG